MGEQISGDLVLVLNIAAVEGYQSSPRLQCVACQLKKSGGFAVGQVVKNGICRDDIVTVRIARQNGLFDAAAIELTTSAIFDFGKINVCLVQIEAMVIYLGQIIENIAGAAPNIQNPISRHGSDVLTNVQRSPPFACNRVREDPISDRQRQYSPQIQFFRQDKTLGKPRPSRSNFGRCLQLRQRSSNAVRDACKALLRDVWLGRQAARKNLCSPLPERVDRRLCHG